jgi:hypothetical protein
MTCSVRGPAPKLADLAARAAKAAAVAAEHAESVDAQPSCISQKHFIRISSDQS